MGNNGTIGCNSGWVFDTSTFGSSAVIDWELVCQKKEMRATAQALFMAGVRVGSYSFGWLSDRAGRKPAFFIAVVIQALVGLLSGLIHHYWAFVLLRWWWAQQPVGSFWSPTSSPWRWLGPSSGWWLAPSVSITTQLATSSWLWLPTYST